MKETPQDLCFGEFAYGFLRGIGSLFGLIRSLFDLIRPLFQVIRLPKQKHPFETNGPNDPTYKFLSGLFLKHR